MRRIFVYTPSAYDPDDYMEDAGGDYEWAAENRSMDVDFELRQAFDNAQEAYLGFKDPRTGEAPIFYQVEISLTGDPYGPYPEGAVEVVMTGPDDMDDLDYNWSDHLSGYRMEADSDSPGYRHRLLSRFNAETRRADAFADELESYGFEEEYYRGDMSELGMIAGDNGGFHNELAFRQPAAWPSRSRRGTPKSKVKAKPKTAARKRDAQGRFVSNSTKSKAKTKTKGARR